MKLLVTRFKDTESNQLLKLMFSRSIAVPHVKDHFSEY